MQITPLRQRFKYTHRVQYKDSKLVCYFDNIDTIFAIELLNRDVQKI